LLPQLARARDAALGIQAALELLIDQRQREQEGRLGRVVEQLGAYDDKVSRVSPSPTIHPLSLSLSLSLPLFLPLTHIHSSLPLSRSLSLAYVIYRKGNVRGSVGRG
jgi:hypothetical protein